MEKRVFAFQEDISESAEEALNVLRTNIRFCNPSEGFKTPTITSCNPLEGKTETSLNLARSFAKAGQRVLLADADLRKPILLKGLGVDYTVGLSNLASNMLMPEDIVYRTNISNVFYAPSGVKPSNPAELLGSYKFAGFLLYAKERFDMVIIDTPPMRSVIDAAVVAAQTDGTLLVVRSRKTKMKAIMQVQRQLEKVNARLLGTVLNNVPKKEYRRYYQFYNYFGKTQQTTPVFRHKQAQSAPPKADADTSPAKKMSET